MLPDKYYEKTNINNTTYNILKDNIPFIVYDSAFSDTSSLAANTIKKQASVLYYAYIKNVTDPKDKYEEKLKESYDTVFNKYNIPLLKSREVSNYFSDSSYNIKSCYISSYEKDIKGNRVYEINSTLNDNLRLTSFFFLRFAMISLYFHIYNYIKK